MNLIKLKKLVFGGALSPMKHIINSDTLKKKKSLTGFYSRKFALSSSLLGPRDKHFFQVSKMILVYR